MLSQWGDELLVDGVLIKSVENDFSDLGVLDRVCSKIHGQVVELAAISFDKDKVEALAYKEVGERFADLCASSINHSSVLDSLRWARLLTACWQMCSLGFQVLLPVRERFEVAVCLSHAAKHSPSKVKRRHPNANIQKYGEEAPWPPQREPVVHEWKLKFFGIGLPSREGNSGGTKENGVAGCVRD